MEENLLKNTNFNPYSCTACPVRCGADRINGVGACGSNLKIAKYYLHPFEEPCISFDKGSGTIFFCGCNLRCVFCQNYELSRAQRGKAITTDELVAIFQKLEEMGADNISLVTPSHLIPFLLPALKRYKPKIPLVYNSSGYDEVEMLKLIDPFVDIYLPDLKFYSPSLSKRYTGKSDYFEKAEKALLFMANKPVRFDERGKMLSGVIVRHLVMPLCSNDSISLLKWFKAHMPPACYLSIMSQYTPFGEIENFPELNRKITAREYNAVLHTAEDLSIENLFVQERSSSNEKYIPSWDF